jgi:hypothetical protein
MIADGAEHLGRTERAEHPAAAYIIPVTADKNKRKRPYLLVAGIEYSPTRYRARFFALFRNSVLRFLSSVF